MRKSLLVGIVVFLIVSGAALAIAWQVQASNIKTSIENAVAEINKGGTVQLTYESLETSGFPSDVVVSIVNPRFAGRLDGFFNQLAKAKNPQAEPLPEWHEDIQIVGTVDVGINALSNRYTMSANGQWKNRSTIGDKSIAIESTPGVTQCTLEMKRGGNWFSQLWDYTLLAERGKEALEDFRLFDCVGTADSYKRTDTQATLVNTGPGRFYITHEKTGDQRQMRFFIKADNIEFTPESDQVLGMYYAAMMPWQDAPLLSAYGKQNMEVDFTYNGPAELNGVNTLRTAPFDIHLSKFVITNDAYNANMALDLVNQKTADGQQTSRFAFKSESTYTDIYDILMKDMVRNLVAQFYAETPKTSPLAKVIEQHSQDELYTIVATAVPNFHALGRLAAGFDFNYNGNSEFTTGDLVLSGLELSAAPYGITGEGSAKLSPQSRIPAVNITLVCRNCLAMIDDLASYAERVQRVMVVFEPEQAPKPIDPKLVEGYKGFLQALAGPAAQDGNFTYTILGDTQSFLINKKRMDEVMMLHRQYVPREQPQAR